MYTSASKAFLFWVLSRKGCLRKPLEGLILSCSLLCRTLQVQIKIHNPGAVGAAMSRVASFLFPHPQGWFSSFPLHHVVVAVCFPSRPLAEHGVHRGLRHTSSVATFADFGKDHCGCRSSRQGEMMIDSLSSACIAFSFLLNRAGPCALGRFDRK